MIKRLLLVFVSMLTIVSVMPVLAQDNDIHINNDTEQMQILNAEPNNHEDNHSSLINDSVENNFEEDTLIQDIILPDTQIILNYLDYCESEIFSYSTQLYDSWNIVDNAIIDAKTNENIFVAETPIKCAYIGINEIFYVTNDTLFRYHILSGTTDFICIAENVLSISPVTNMAGALFVENSAAKEPDVNYFDLTIGNKLLTESERVSQLGLEWRNSISTYSNEDSSVNSTNSSNNGEYGIYQIGNASLPLSNYRAGIGAYPYNNGWYFNRTTSSDIDVASTEECSIHSDDDSQNVDCWEVEGGYQCLAFAYYVYEHIWGEYWTDGRGDSIDEEYDCNMSFSSMDEYELYEYFENNIPLGSHIRVTSGSAYHSIILLDYNETNITYYHANYNSDFCRVFKDTLSWNEFKYRFPTCWYFVYPNANQIMTCSHTFGTPSSYTSEGHTVVCTECGAIATQNHTLQMSSTSNGHTEYCLYCNYFGSEVAHTPGWVTSSTGHTQKCTVTGCAYTITAEAAHSLSLYSRDDTYHDQKCSVCSYDTGVSGVHSKTYSLQSGTSNHIISCSSCDYSKTEAHSNIAYTYTSATHSQKCGVCDYSISTANHGYSYTSNGTGSHQKYCGTCGYVASTNAAHTFSYGSWTYS